MFNHILNFKQMLEIWRDIINYLRKAFNLDRLVSPNLKTFHVIYLFVISALSYLL